MNPESEPPEDDLVDEAGMESFPASDPPPFWARAEPVPRPPHAARDLRDGCFE